MFAEMREIAERAHHAHRSARASAGAGAFPASATPPVVLAAEFHGRLADRLDHVEYGVAFLLAQHFRRAGAPESGCLQRAGGPCRRARGCCASPCSAGGAGASGWLAGGAGGVLARAFAMRWPPLFGTASWIGGDTDAFDALVAVAAIVATADDEDGVARGGVGRKSGNAALRRAGRADVGDVTMGSSWKPRPMCRGEDAAAQPCGLVRLCGGPCAGHTQRRARKR